MTEEDRLKGVVDVTELAKTPEPGPQMFAEMRKVREAMHSVSSFRIVGFGDFVEDHEFMHR